MQPRHYKALSAGQNIKGVTLSAEDAMNGPLEVEITWHSKRDQTRVHRNVEKGKGSRLSHRHISDIKVVGDGVGDGLARPIYREAPHEGGRLSLKSVAKGIHRAGKAALKNKHVRKVLHAAAKELAPVVGEQAEKAALALTGSEPMANIAHNVASRAFHHHVVSRLEDHEGGKLTLKGVGRSIKKAAKTVGKALSSKTARSVYSELAAPVATLAAQGAVTYATGNPQAGKMAGQVAGKMAGKYAAPAIAGNGLLPTYPTTFVGGPVLPGAAQSQPMSVHERMAIVRSHRKTAAKGDGVATPASFAPLGGSVAAKESMAERMARVRSYRKGGKRGGSFLPLGNDD